MTRNEILYQQNVENRRHNQVSEGQADRDLSRKELELSETQRHNQATEAEANRHNVAGEYVSLGGLNESIRHNRANEAVARTNAYENIRHNQATESIQLGNLTETTRHNQVSEGIQVTLGDRTQAEVERHNQATEAAVIRGQDINKSIADDKNTYEFLINSMNNESRERIANAQNRSRELIAELDRLSREDIAFKNRVQNYVGMSIDALKEILSKVDISKYLRDASIERALRTLRKE